MCAASAHGGPKNRTRGASEGRRVRLFLWIRAVRPKSTMEQLPDLRIQRPYASLDEYLEGDFWTVERKDMFLIGAPSFDQGVAVKFTIELADGTPAVTGEGRVVEYMAPSEEFPGGLKVRFRQLDADAKAVLRRALELRRAYAAAMAVEEAAAAEAARADAPPPADADPVPIPVAAPAAVPVPALAGPAPVPVPILVPAASPSTPPRPRAALRARSSVRVVAAPPNRDALLGRLRERAGRFKSASAGPRLP
jgi:hypothetical protein